MSSPRSLSLSDFFRFLEQQYRSAQACYKETDEVRQGLTEAFTREMAAWQEVFAAAYPDLEARRAELPPAFAAHVDRVEAEERQRQQDELAALDKQVAEGKARSDELLAAAQEHTEVLRHANPRLNEQEEALKALVVQYEDEYAHAYEQEAALRAESWNPLHRWGEVRRLRRAQQEAKRRQQAEMAKLRKLRQDWLERVKEAGDKQAALRQEWQQVGVETSEAQTRRDHLRENFDTLALEATYQRVLSELDAPPDVPGEFGERLADLARRNAVRASYERALEVSAEFLGRTRGVATGLEKFGTSVASVVREQRRYNLKNVQVRIPPSVHELLGTFDAVRARFQDAARWAAQPDQVSALLDSLNRTRLSDGDIQDLFETMGEELNRATAAWN